MKRTNIILTSMFAICVAMPAMATSYDAGDTGTCNNDALGAYSGTVSATANFTPIQYECQAGYYLPADAIACVQCPVGSYCEGDTYTYNQTDAQGANLCDDEYTGTTSSVGASSVEGCYWANVSCPTVSANTNCDTHAASCAYSGTSSGNFYPETGEFTGSCALTFTCASGWTKTTKSAPTMPDAATAPSNYQYRSHIQNGDTSNNDNDLTAGQWKATWTSGATQGTIKGIASCNAVPGDNGNWSWPNASKADWTLPANTDLASNSADANDSSRRYCWCKPTSWTASGGAEQSLSAAWVFRNDLGDAGNCAFGCASVCADYVNNDSGFRAAVLGVVGASEQCVANTITINWGGYGANNDQNETNTCTYGETLTAPSTAPSKKGHTFAGWTFGE